MNIWLIVVIVLGLLVATGIVVSSLSVAQETEETESRGCDNNCNTERTCGRQDCGAVYGATCGCGK